VLRKNSVRRTISVQGSTLAGTWDTSFKFGGVIFEPGWHIGRDPQLTQGVAVGATSSEWKARFPMISSRLEVHPARPREAAMRL
jgi:hypothetical protein